MSGANLVTRSKIWHFWLQEVQWSIIEARHEAGYLVYDSTEISQIHKATVGGMHFSWVSIEPGTTAMILTVVASRRPIHLIVSRQVELRNSLSYDLPDVHEITISRDEGLTIQLPSGDRAAQGPHQASSGPTGYAEWDRCEQEISR
jgi:hypothetical protein